MPLGPVEDVAGEALQEHHEGLQITRLRNHQLRKQPALETAFAPNGHRQRVAIRTERHRGKHHRLGVIECLAQFVSPPAAAPTATSFPPAGTRRDRACGEHGAHQVQQRLHRSGFRLDRQLRLEALGVGGGPGGFRQRNVGSRSSGGRRGIHVGKGSAMLLARAGRKTMARGISKTTHIGSDTTICLLTDDCECNHF